MVTLYRRLFVMTRALNHPVRLQLLYYLMENGKSNVTQLVDQVEVSQPAVSRHLRILEDAQLITRDQAGKEHFYSLKDQHVKALLDNLRNHVQEK
ncbi:ArsR/SmtB family transcription factor [Lentilactobacillus raoultii]|uniref:ArsR/SmtB family transcription factor n=1 Tax=Lentilactobacillus raoultii TaxID=1987503 RepID=A0ABW3PH52_9LACO|nr:metalloregulator ArsR/SmtB family transcription factor [Lentilactobacillus raoultii]